jgi:hypothetical protein
MSYRIEYDSNVGKYEVRKVHPGRLPLIVGCVMMAALVMFPRSRETVRALLIPGEDAVTVAAVEIMTNDLKSGAGLYDAVFDFCSMVIHGS